MTFAHQTRSEPHVRGCHLSRETGKIRVAFVRGVQVRATCSPTPSKRLTPVEPFEEVSTLELGGERLPGRPSNGFQVVTKCENPALALASPIRPVTMEHTAAQAKVTAPPTLRARALKNPRYSPLPKSCRKAVFDLANVKVAFDGDFLRYSPLLRPRNHSGH